MPVSTGCLLRAAAVGGGRATLALRFVRQSSARIHARTTIVTYNCGGRVWRRSYAMLILAVGSSRYVLPERGYSYAIPSRTANAAAAAREGTPSLRNVFSRWRSTVFSLRTNAAAISRFDFPRDQAEHLRRALRDPTGESGSSSNGRTRRWALR